MLAIADELIEEGLVLRYRTDEIEEEPSGEEGAFAIASFWLVSALVEIGEGERASRLCERLLSPRAPSACTQKSSIPSRADISATSPAFNHLAFINAVLHVIRDASGVPLSSSG